MKTISFFFLLLFFSMNVLAQFSKDQRIQDSVIGWWDNNRFDKSLKPTTDPVQLKRIAQVDKLVQWVKKSYTPVAGLGTFRRENPKTSSGVRFMTWNVSYDPLWIDSKGHFTPVAEEQVSFGIHYNTVPSSYPVPFLNGTGTYYFVWPSDGYRGYSSRKPEARIPLKSYPNISKYITRSNESEIVILAPDNKLPFVPVTIGEYLDGAEASLDKELAKDPSESRQKQFDKFRTQIGILKKRYEKQLLQPAVIRDMQPTLYNFDGNVDPFSVNVPEKNVEVAFEVYKIPKEVMQEAQTDKVKWVAAWFNYETPELSNRNYEIYRAMTEQLNYDYIYDYFFNPEAVKGKEYTPKNEKQWTARLDAYRNKYKNAAASMDKKASTKPTGSLFWEDFSDDAAGSFPSGWFARPNGKKSVIASIPDVKGNWLKLGYGNPVFPNGMKKPLPENFVLEFDIAGDADFKGLSGGAVNLRLSTSTLSANSEENYGAKSSIDILITAGLDANLKAGSNYRGALKVDIHSPGDKNKEHYNEGIFFSQSQNAFTDQDTRVHVKVAVNKGVCTVSLDGKELANSATFKMSYGGACVQCGLAAGVKFNTVYWTNKTVDGEETNVYLGNVKLVEVK